MRPPGTVKKDNKKHPDKSRFLVARLLGMTMILGSGYAAREIPRVAGENATLRDDVSDDVRR
jgi:hypothetical protein